MSKKAVNMTRLGFDDNKRLIVNSDNLDLNVGDHVVSRSGQQFRVSASYLSHLALEEVSAGRLADREDCYELVGSPSNSFMSDLQSFRPAERVAIARSVGLA